MVKKGRKKKDGRERWFLCSSGRKCPSLLQTWIVGKKSEREKDVVI